MWPVDPRSSEGKIAWSSAIHDAAEQYGMHCSVGHRYHHYKSLSRELKLMCSSLLYCQGVLIAELPMQESLTLTCRIRDCATVVYTYN